MLEQQLEDDLKQAMLSSDSFKVQTLRTVKSVLLNKKVADGTRDTQMSDDDVVTLLTKEAKKRQESADMYNSGNRPELAEKELAEKAVIDSYLPEQMSEADLTELVNQVVSAQSDANMGQIIGQVKAQAGAGADGALIAKLVRERLASA